MWWRSTPISEPKIGGTFPRAALLLVIPAIVGCGMRPLAILGVALIVLGIVGLIVGRFSYTTQEKVLDLGPLQATAQKEHSVAIPDIAGIAAILAGGFLVYVGRRRT
jgi:hypothetical protein